MAFLLERDAAASAPAFARPQAMYILLYLDDIDDNDGPICIVASSHH